MKALLIGTARPQRRWRRVKKWWRGSKNGEQRTPELTKARLTHPQTLHHRQRPRQHQQRRRQCQRPCESRQRHQRHHRQRHRQHHRQHHWPRHALRVDAGRWPSPAPSAVLVWCVPTARALAAVSAWPGRGERDFTLCPPRRSFRTSTPHRRPGQRGRRVARGNTQGRPDLLEPVYWSRFGILLARAHPFLRFIAGAILSVGSSGPARLPS